MSSRLRRTKVFPSRPRPRPRKTPPPKPPPPPLPILTLLKSTAASSPAAAVRLLLSSEPHHQHYPAFASLLHLLARRRHFSLIPPLLSRLLHRQIPTKPPLFHSLLSHLPPNSALRLFRSLPSFNCRPHLPDTHSLNHLLPALSHHSLSALSLPRRLGIRPNAVTYNIILRSAGPAAAGQVLDEMLTHRIRPSVVTYNTLIKFMIDINRVQDAIHIKDEMVRVATAAAPNAVTYAILMRGLCGNGEYGAARKMMFDMEYQGCQARAVNYGVLVSDCGRRGDFEGMREVMGEMRRKGVKMDGVMYTMLVHFLCVEGRVEEAYKVLVDMQVKGSKPGAAAYRMVMDGFCGLGEFEMGLRVCSAMRNDGHWPRTETVGCLTLGLCESGRWDGVCFVLEEMEKREMGLGEDGWIALVQKFCGQCDHQIGLLSELTF